MKVKHAYFAMNSSNRVNIFNLRQRQRPLFNQARYAKGLINFLGFKKCVCLEIRNRLALFF